MSLGLPAAANSGQNASWIFSIRRPYVGPPSTSQENHVLIAKPPLSSNAQAQPRAARSEAEGCTSAGAPGWATRFPGEDEPP